VRTAGSESWHVSIEDEQTTHAVLFVRDACGLTPDDDPVVPPRLVGEVPDLGSSMTRSDRTRASAAWTDWWRRVAEFEGAKELGEITEGATREDALRRLTAAYAAVFDPPDFECLAAWPTLQSMSRTTCQQALRWHRHSATPIPPDHARWLVTKAVAEEACAAFHVSPSRLNAAVIALAVEGTWWNFPQPGVLLCSQEVLNEDGLFAPLLRETFARRLALGGRPVG
jgi:hypothetical protein